jgi:hypothetical protein
VDVVQSLGSRIGSPFIDGGIHPRFGTRNFVLPLKNNHYIEVVCPLDHPAAEESPFGKAVSKRANEGGGWMSWVVSTSDITPVESRLGRSSVIGSRRRPDGTELKWKQIGVLGTIEDFQLPFFIEWITFNHPSADNIPTAEIKQIDISGEEKIIENWLGSDLREIFEDVQVEFSEGKRKEADNGITAVTFLTSTGTFVRIE